MPPLSPPPLPLRRRPSPPLLIAAALVLFTSLFSSAHTAHPPSCGFFPAAADHNHHNPPSCGHYHHHEHRRALLAEEEGLELDGFDLHDHHHFHDGGSDLEFSTIGLWARAMGCSLLVSMASLICLAILPLIFVQGKPSKVIVDSLALFGRVTSTRAIADDRKDTYAGDGSLTKKPSSIEIAPPARLPLNLVFGYLNLFSDGVHNFTDGMALGSAFLLHGSVGGWSRTLFLLAHELPQEVGDFGILMRYGLTIFKALAFNFLSALAGTALALVLGKQPGQSSLIEGFTAGGFIYIAVAGVLPEMNSEKTTFRGTMIQLTSLSLRMAIALGISLVE